MNRALVGKSFKTIALASTMTLAATAVAYAQDAPVALGSAATLPLTSIYASPPSGAVTLGGAAFNLGNYALLAVNQSATFAASYPSPKAVHLLLNTENTWSYFDGIPVGTATLTFSNGTTQIVPLTSGVNIREWRIGAGSVVVSHPLTDPAATNGVWNGLATDGTAAAIDMLTVSVPPTVTASLASVSVTNTAFGSLGIHVSGLSVSYTPPAPAPTPTPSTSGSGGSGHPTGDSHGHKVHHPKVVPKTHKADIDSKTTAEKNNDKSETGDKGDSGNHPTHHED
jgi:hypothetical protein